MILENIAASFFASVLAFTSVAGSVGESIKTVTPHASAQVTQSAQADGTWRGWGDWRSSRPVITSLTPESGPTGTTVTLTGKRFDDDSVVRLGKGVITDVEVSKNGKSLSFEVPEEMGQYCPPWRVCTAIALEVTPGDYQVRVQDGTKTSNALTFEVTESDTDEDLPLVINRVEGPSNLLVNEEGEWEVVVESEIEGNLQYSVKWGDENWSPLRLLRLDEKTQSSAFFTHTYENEGTYHPEFKVIDEAGNEATSSVTVIVDEEGSDIPHIVSLNSATATVGAMATITGTSFDSDSIVKVGTATATNITVVNDTTITFKVPALSLGTHAVTVIDNDGTSNKVDLTIVSAGKVSISGVSAPTRLVVGEEGTWTVNAATQSSGNLTYSVDWGESFMARMLSSNAVETQSSATFTHSYENQGTYYPRFTVTDENGKKATVSASVIVEAN